MAKGKTIHHGAEVLALRLAVSTYAGTADTLQAAIYSLRGPSDEPDIPKLRPPHVLTGGCVAGCQGCEGVRYGRPSGG